MYSVKSSKAKAKKMLRAAVLAALYAGSIYVGGVYMPSVALAADVSGSKSADEITGPSTVVSGATLTLTGGTLRYGLTNNGTIELYGITLGADINTIETRVGTVKINRSVGSTETYAVDMTPTAANKIYAEELHVGEGVELKVNNSYFDTPNQTKVTNAGTVHLLIENGKHMQPVITGGTVYYEGATSGNKVYMDSVNSLEGDINILKDVELVYKTSGTQTKPLKQGGGAAITHEADYTYNTDVEGINISTSESSNLTINLAGGTFSNLTITTCLVNDFGGDAIIGTVQISGPVNMTGTGAIGGYGDIEVLEEGTLDMSASTGNLGGGHKFINAGTIKMGSGSLNRYGGYVDFKNTGTIELYGTTLECDINTSSEKTGTVHISNNNAAGPGDTLDLTASGAKNIYANDLTVDTGAIFKIDGSDLDNVAATSVTNEGTIVVKSGTVRKTVNDNGGTLEVDSTGTITFDNGITGTGGTFKVTDGTAAFNSAAGIIGNTTITVAASKTLDMSASSGNISGASTKFENNGTIKTGTGTYSDALTNNSGGVLELAKAGAFTGAITNKGTVNATNADGVMALRSTITNTTGTVNLQGTATLNANGKISGGTLNIGKASGDTITITAAGDQISADTTTVNSSSTLILTGGTLGGKVTGAGTLKISGAVSSDASYIAATTNTVDIGKTLTLTDGTLGSKVTGVGNIVINGAVTSNADNLANTGTLSVNSGGTVTLSGGTLGKAITNTGTVNLDGITSMTAAVTGGTLNINQTLETSAGNIKGNTNNIQSSKTLTLNDGILEGKISGDGNVVIDGTVTANASHFANEGDLVVDDGDKLILNGGTLGKNVGGTGTTQGTTQLAGDVTVSQDIEITGTLDGNGKTLNMAGTGGGSNLNTLTVGTLAGTTNFVLDMDMSVQGNAHGDKIIAGTVAGDAKINISNINIVEDFHPQSPIMEFPVAPNVEIQYLTYSGSSGVSQYSVTGGELIVATNTFTYKFTNGDNAGYLKWTLVAAGVGSVKSYIEGTLPGYIGTTSDPYTLSLTGNMTYSGTTAEELTADETKTEQTNNTLSINLNGHNITTSGTDSMTIKTGDKTLNIDGGSETAGHMDTNFTVGTGGTLAFSGNIKLTGNIDNTGTVTFVGTTDISGKLSGTGSYTNSGTMNVNDASKLAMSGTQGLANAGTLNLGSASSSALGANITGNGSVYVNDSMSFTGAVSQKELHIADGKTLTIDSADLTISSGVDNQGTLIIGASNLKSKVTNVAADDEVQLQAGTLASGSTISGGGITITGAVTANADDLASTEGITNDTANQEFTLNGGNIKDKITGVGTLKISGTVTNTEKKSITQNALTIDSTGELITEAETININGNTGTITNNGKLTLTADGTDPVTLEEAVSGTTGIIYVNDSMSFTGAVSQEELHIADGKTLTIGNADLTISSGVDNQGTLIIGASNLKSKVINSAEDDEVQLQAGALASDSTITGGKISVKGDVSANVSDLHSTAGISVDAEKTLTLTGEGELGDNITGETIIEGTVTGAKTIDGNVTVQSGGSFTNNTGGTITGPVTNNGTLTTIANGITGGVTNNNILTLNSGELACDITGSGGGTIIAGDVTITGNKTITQGTLIVNATTGNLTTEVDKLVISGGITNNGTLTLTADGSTDTLQETVTGEGTLNFNGSNKITAMGTINQTTVNVNTDVDMNNTLTAGTITIETNKTLTMATGKDLTISGSDVITNKGKIVADAGNLKGNVTNTGTVELRDGTLGTYTITGGSIAVKGDVTANVINLKSREGISVDTAKTLTLTGTGELGDMITGTGNVIIGNATSTKINALGTQLAGNTGLTVATQGELSLTAGTLSKDITNNGTVVMKEGTAFGTDKKISGGNVTIGTDVEFTNNNLENTANLDLNNAKYNFHADISNGNITVDRIVVSGEVTGTVKLGTVNITSSGDNTCWDVGISKQAVFISGGSSGHTVTISNTIHNTSEGYLYSFSQYNDGNNNVPGTMNILKEMGFTLKEIVDDFYRGSTYASTIDSFDIVGTDYVETEDLGKLKIDAGDIVVASRKLNIEGNGFHFAGGNHTGIETGTADTLSLSSISVIENWNGYVVKNEGTLKIAAIPDDLATSTTVESTLLDSAITGAGRTNVTSGNLKVGNNGSITQKELNISEGVKLETNADKLSIADGINNAGDLILTGGTSNGNISGTGTTYIRGTVTGTGNIGSSIEVESAATFTNSGTLSGHVENNGTLNTFFEGIKNITAAGGAGVTNNGTMNIGGGTLAGNTITNTADGTVYFKGIYNISRAIIDSAGTAITVLDGKVKVAPDSKIKLGNLTKDDKGKSFRIYDFGGTAVQGEANSWGTLPDGIYTDKNCDVIAGTALKKFSLADGLITLLVVGSNFVPPNSPEEGIRTSAYGIGNAMADENNNEKVVALIDTISDLEGARGTGAAAETFNAAMNINGAAAVEHGAIRAMNMVGEAVSGNLSIIARPVIQVQHGAAVKNTSIRRNKKVKIDKIPLGDADRIMPSAYQEQVYEKIVWASYMHNKEDIDGLQLDGAKEYGSAQYNGAIVGIDLWSSRKMVGGMAVSYTDGKVNSNISSASTRNEVDYYGVSVYNRWNYSRTGILADVGYMMAKNDITQRIVNNEDSANAKTNALTVGVRAEQLVKIGRSNLLPFAGIRYMYNRNGDYKIWGSRYTPDNQHIVSPQLGVVWNGDFPIPGSKWTFRPTVECGYVWNLGDRHNRSTISFGGASDTIGYDVADKGSYYGQLGMEFRKKNIVLGATFKYQKGDTVTNRKWNISVGFTF